MSRQIESPSNLDGGPDLDTVRKTPTDTSSDVEQEETDERSPEVFVPDGTPPSADDPYVVGSPEITGGLPEEMAPRPMDEDGPSYERDQGPVDDMSGGSTDPANSRSHSDNEPE